MDQATRAACGSLFADPRERLVDPLLETERRYAGRAAKRLVYLSIEYLLGRVLGSALANMGALESWRAALAELGLTLEDVEAHEPEPAVGNGGLGRLAACFLDSLATHGYPAHGYGINYEFGLFKQVIEGGWQRERPITGWRPLSMADRAGRRRLHRPLYGRIETSTMRRAATTRAGRMQILLGVP